MCCVAFVFFVMLTLFGFFFFFQAEDGIRDRDVTGVQTCALPICTGVTGSHKIAATVRRAFPRFLQHQTVRRTLIHPIELGWAQRSAGHPFSSGFRSEERRVGKECRLRWTLESSCERLG